MENTVNANINIDTVIDNIKEDAVPENGGSINIADEVVAVISSMAANEVEGVAGMVGGVAGGFAELLGKKNLSKGVRTVREGDCVTVYLAVVVEYGAKIPDVSWNLQTKVKADIEAMTGLKVTAVNISVEGITYVADKEEASQDESVKKEADSANKSDSAAE